MNGRKTYNIINFGIALVWVTNGLFCKIFNLAPRHQQIVGEILSYDYSRVLTIIIGLSELLMAIWVISKFQSKLNALAQISIVGLMNILEYILVPDLLLWGKLNSLFAILFILLICFNEFYLKKNNNFDMLSFLKNHPFSVESFFESSTVLTFAVPKEQLQNLIPECLTLDTFKDKWAFVAVAMVQTKELRPKGFPKFMGNDFFLVGFRVFVRYTTKKGKNLRGLYILKSETNKKKMEVIGNIFTHYNYTTTDIIQFDTDETKEISSTKSNFKLILDKEEHDVALPVNSPFANWKEARRYAGPLPFTFTYNEETNEVLIIEGVRSNWKPSPVKVIHHSFEFLNTLKLKNPILANAFVIKNIPYEWKKGKIELWN